MASFAIFGPKGQNRIEPAQIVLVSEGFSFWGFLLPLPYCLWHRNWRFSGLLILIGLILGLLPDAGIPVSEISALGIEILMGLYVGCAAADIRAAALERRDHNLLDVVVARDEEAAFLRFLDQCFKGAANCQPVSPPNAPSPVTNPIGVPPIPLEASGILGLFPESRR